MKTRHPFQQCKWDGLPITIAAPASLLDAISSISLLCQTCQQLQFSGSPAVHLQLHSLLRAEEEGRRRRELSELKKKSVFEVNKVC